MAKSVREPSGWSDRTLSTIHHTLRAPRRRVTIALVANSYVSSGEVDSDPFGIWHSPDPSDTTVEVRQLARQVVAAEEGILPDQASGKPYHSAYSTLSQTHLPVLDDVGAISYDADRQTVAPAQNLLAFAVAMMMIATVTEFYFDSTDAEHYAGGAHSQDSFDQ